MSGEDADKAERLAAALRENLRRRKAQRGRADLSGLDPKRRDTPLHGALRSDQASAPESGRNDPDKDGPEDS